MLKITTLTIAAFGLAAVSAAAATLNFSVVVTGTPSTSISCPLAASYVAPLAPGTVICPITVSPTGWTGLLSLSGTGASVFQVDSTGTHVVVGPTAVADGTYSMTLSSTP